MSRLIGQEVQITGGPQHVRLRIGRVIRFTPGGFPVVRLADGYEAVVELHQIRQMQKSK